MKNRTSAVLIALLVITLPAINCNTFGLLGLEFGTAEAGPLSKRHASKHKPSPHPQNSTHGGDSEAQEQCIKLLHQGDHEGAHNCIAEMQGGDAGETQAIASQAQPAAQSSQPANATSPATVQSASSGTQGELYDAREKCAEMLRSGDRAGARDCIGKLKK